LPTEGQSVKSNAEKKLLRLRGMRHAQFFGRAVCRIGFVVGQSSPSLSVGIPSMWPGLLPQSIILL
jgi:hypothetical protein